MLEFRVHDPRCIEQNPALFLPPPSSQNPILSPLIWHITLHLFVHLPTVYVSQEGLVHSALFIIVPSMVETRWSIITYYMKQRYHFAEKGPYSQSYGFSSSHVWMWELDHKEGLVPKNWCFQTVVLEKTLESPLGRKDIKTVNPKRNQPWIFIGRTDAEAEAPILGLPGVRSWFIGKDPDAGTDWGQEEKRTTEDEMVGWHHWLNGHEFE